MSKTDDNFTYWQARPNADTWRHLGDDLTYNGRNGCGTCQGMIALNAQPNVVSLQPINSKGEIANCRIDIPRDALIELAEWLKEKS